MSAYAVQAAEPGDNGLPHFSSVHLFMDPSWGHPAPELGDYPGQVTTDLPQAFSVDHLGAGSVAFTKEGTLKSVRLAEAAAGRVVPTHLTFATYGARKGNERSGAYLFLPDGPARPLQENSGKTKSVVLLIQGPLEARVQVSLSYILHETIMRPAGNGEAAILEIRNLVDISDTHNTELVMRIATDISNHDEFYTDLNGLQMIRRKRFDKLPLQANYYPVPSAIYLQDDNTRLTIISGQPLGGTSLRSGSIEIMQDRRLDQDDNRGLGQGVLDNKPVLHHFRVILEPRKCSEEPNLRTPVNPAGYLSRTALLLRDALQYPLDKMLYSQDGWPERMLRKSSITLSSHPQTSSTAATKLPQGVFLGSMSVEKHKSSSTRLGLLLHRPQHDTCTSTGSIDEEHDFVINMTSLFKVRRPKSYRESSLTLLDTRGAPSISTKPLSLCPMDVKAILVDF